MKKILLLAGYFICIFAILTFAANAQNLYDYRIDRLQNSNYELQTKANYLEKRLESLEKSNKELIKQNIEIRKDLQREIEKQQLLVNAANEFSKQNINKSIDTINGFSIELRNSQMINFIALTFFLLILAALIIYTLINVKRMTRLALENENKNFLREKVNKVNKDFEKTLNTIVHSALTDAEKKIKEASINGFSDKSNFQNYISEGQKLMKVGKFEESIDAFNQAIEHKPNNPTGYYHNGLVLLQIGEFDQAISNFEMATKLDPVMYDAINQKGMALLKKGDFENAVKAFDQVIRLNKDFVWAYNNKGIVLYQQKKYEESIDFFNQAIEIKNDFANAYHNRASSFLALNLNDKAIKDFTRSIELEGGLVGTLK